MSESTDFVTWASDPARSSDELFTVERLIERTQYFSDWPFRERSEDLSALSERMRERKFNPGYRPALALDEIKALQQRTATIKYFSGMGASDRPLRNIEALRFFHALEEVDLKSSALTDLSPLAGLTLLCPCFRKAG